MNQTQSQRDNLLLGKKITSEIASEYGKRGQPKSTEAKKIRRRPVPRPGKVPLRI